MDQDLLADRRKRWNDIRRVRYQADAEYRQSEIDRTRKRYQDSPEVRAKTKTAWAKKRVRLGRIGLLIKQRRCNANRRGVEFALSVGALDWPTVCPVLGIELDYGLYREFKGNIDNYPTIDRWDNTKGYTPENCFVVSKRANQLKGDATAAELEAVARYARAGVC